MNPAGHFRFLPLLLMVLLASPLAAPAKSVSDVPMGAVVQGEGAARVVVFRVWAPNAQKVEVTGDFNGWKKDALRSDPSKAGHWVLESRRARPGDAYQFLIDGVARRDPRARAVKQHENKGYILDPRKFVWEPPGAWTMPPREQLVMYQMHVGTFAAGIPGQGSAFQLAIRRLPYLKALGINCIQLMPINEFSGDHSWGYNPGDLFAVEQAYGGPLDFQAFVRACHTNGMAVLLDIVHNHYGPQQVAAWQFDQPHGAKNGGSYFYQDPDRAQTPWGPRPNFSLPEVRTFIIDSVRMFLEEYRLDGFRWDSVHNIRYTQDGARSNADGDRLLSDANAWMAKNHPHALRIAEDHAFDGGGVGFEAQWHSSFQTAIADLVCAPPAQRNLRHFADQLERLDGYRWVVFAECHDSAGDLNNHRRLPANIDPENPNSYAARALALLANGIALTVPGYPMFLQGLEMHETIPFSAEAPLPWAKALGPNKGLVLAHSDLIKLRRNLKNLTPGLQGEQLHITHLDNQTKVMAYARRARNVTRDKSTVVVLHLSDTPRQQVGVRFPASGAWYCHYNSGASTYAKDFDNVGPMPGTGYQLPAGRHTLALNLSRYSILVFSQSRPGNATLSRAPDIPEVLEIIAEEDAAHTDFVEEEYIELEVEPFPYIFVPLPAEWKP